MTKPWYASPKDADGWPLWVPWLTEWDFDRRTLMDWLNILFAGRTHIYVRMRQICGGSVVQYCWNHSNAEQAAVWNNLCRELGYTGKHHYV